MGSWKLKGQEDKWWELREISVGQLLIQYCILWTNIHENCMADSKENYLWDQWVKGLNVVNSILYERIHLLSWYVDQNLAW